MGLTLLLRLISGLFPHAGLFFNFVTETGVLLIWGIFAPIDIIADDFRKSQTHLPRYPARIIHSGNSTYLSCDSTLFIKRDDKLLLPSHTEQHRKMKIDCQLP